jgi:hypothetical protein
MPKIEHRFFRKGTSIQKRSDITIILSRPDMKNIETWSAQQKEATLTFLADAQKFFNTFSETIKQAVTSVNK